MLLFLILHAFFLLFSAFFQAHNAAKSQEENSIEFWRVPAVSDEDISSAGIEEQSGQHVDDSDERVPFIPKMRREKEDQQFPRRESPPVAGIQRLDPDRFCFGNDSSFPLGPCSSTFLKCGGHFKNANQRHSFEECPLGKVFVGGKECKPVRKVRGDCFSSELNLLNDATEKLAQAVDFCARKDPFKSAIYFFDGPAKEDKCSKQALLCQGMASAPLAFSCPSGKVFDPKLLQCVDAPKHCASVSGSAHQTPIRHHLLRLFCAQSKTKPDPKPDPLDPPLFPKSIQTLVDQQQASRRCRNWYFVCESADNEPEMVFCESGQMFDPIQRICRRILPEDRCPNLGVCRGWEWRMSPVGVCRPDFLYCNGMRPQLFQCERPGEVFIEGDCTLASNACDVCQPNEVKRSLDKCEEVSGGGRYYAFCGSVFCGRNGRTRWRQYMCTNGRLFHPQRKECVKADEYQCPTRKQCQEGDSYSVECGDFFLCNNQGQFVASKCPDMTHWDGNERRCVFSANCRRFQEPHDGNWKCLEGQTKPSEDCKKYEECNGGNWVQRRCMEYTNDRLEDPCQFCSEPPSVFQHRDFYPLERLLPAGFNPFHGQGVKQRKCVEGEKIVNRFDCASFMECLDGDWFNLLCPPGHYFSPRSQDCVLASSTNSSAVPMCQDLIPAPTGLSSVVSGQLPLESVHLLPLYSPNDILLFSAEIGPSAEDSAEIGPSAEDEDEDE